jgi:Fe-Mn family superoxide dismutase
MFTLPKLNFEYSDLEPTIDAQTMEIHHTKHHQGYINKLNAALEEHPELLKKEINEILLNFKNLPDEIKKAVRNNGGGHSNHTLFWSILSPQKTEPSGALLQAINDTFGSFETFKNQFEEATAAQFGSGWGWLVKTENNDLKIVTTPNQDSPLMDNQTPIFGVDVWEHAYYLHYQNRRPDYLSSIWEIINWDQVAEYYGE